MTNESSQIINFECKKCKQQSIAELPYICQNCSLDIFKEGVMKNINRIYPEKNFEEIYDKISESYKKFESEKFWSWRSMKRLSIHMLFLIPVWYLIYMRFGYLCEWFFMGGGIYFLFYPNFANWINEKI
jgi:hypothetical protein